MNTEDDLPTATTIICALIIAVLIVFTSPTDWLYMVLLIR